MTRNVLHIEIFHLSFHRRGGELNILSELLFFLNSFGKTKASAMTLFCSVALLSILLCTQLIDTVLGLQEENPALHVPWQPTCRCFKLKKGFFFFFFLSCHGDDS